MRTQIEWRIELTNRLHINYPAVEKLFDVLPKFIEDIQSEAKAEGIAEAEKLVQKLEEYNNLLIDELNETAGIAHAHGWRTTRLKEGEKIRNEILNLKKSHENI